MSKIKVELWNNHEIRFIEKEPGDWWGVAADIAKALGLKQVTRAINNLPRDGVTTSKVIDSMGREQQSNIISEKSIYRLVFKSKKPDAVSFQDWVFEMIKSLRKSSGLEGFQIFRMLDKEHQREAMSRLSKSLETPARIDFIKANTVANKTISNFFGHKKMLKKDQMSPDMLIKRQQVLDDTVELMGVNDSFCLGVSVSKAVYEKYRAGVSQGVPMKMEEDRAAKLREEFTKPSRDQKERNNPNDLCKRPRRKSN